MGEEAVYHNKPSAKHLVSFQVLCSKPDLAYQSRLACEAYIAVMVAAYVHDLKIRGWGLAAVIGKNVKHLQTFAAIMVLQF